MSKKSKRTDQKKFHLKARTSLVAGKPMEWYQKEWQPSLPENFLNRDGTLHVNTQPIFV